MKNETTTDIINVVLPVLEQFDKYEEFLKLLDKPNIKVFVGLREKDNKSLAITSKNIKLFFFKNSSKKEEIINALHSKLEQEGKVLVARRPLEKFELDNLLSQNADICTLKKKQSKFAAFFSRLLQTVIKKAFAFSYFEDISAVCFSKNMFNLIKSLTNLSYITRIDRFVGLSYTEIETNIKKPKRDFKKPQTIFNLLAFLVLFAGGIASSVCICLFVPISVLAVMGVIAILVVTTVLFAIAVLNFLRTVAVGTLRYKRAEELSLV